MSIHTCACIHVPTLIQSTNCLTLTSWGVEHGEVRQGRAFLGLVLNVQLSTASVHVAKAEVSRGTDEAGFGHVSALGRTRHLFLQEAGTWAVGE